MYSALFAALLVLTTPGGLAAPGGEDAAKAEETDASALLYDRDHTSPNPVYMDTLIDACAKKAPGGCQYLLQVIMNNGQGNFQADIRRMVTPIYQACEDGEQAACAIKGRMMLSGYTQREPTPVIRQFLDTACTAGVSEACALIIENLLLDEGSEKSMAEARELADRTCESLGGAACVSKAAILVRALSSYQANNPNMDDSSIPQDKKDEIDAVSDRACDTGSALGCWATAQRAFGSGKPPKDPVTARAAYVKGCDLGHGMACHNLAWALREGTGGEVGKPDEVAKLFIKACGLKDEKACHRLPAERDIHRPVLEAQGLLKPKSTDPDQNFDDPLGRLVCDYFESAEACFNLGYMLNNRTNVIKEIIEGADEATFYMQRACVLGSDSSCRVMGHFLKGSRRGCEQDKDSAACSMYGFILKQGGWMHMYLGLPPWPDYQKASEAFGVACEQDVVHTCALQAAFKARADAQDSRTEYHSDRRGKRGARKAEGPLKDGKRHGEWTRWYPTSEVYAKVTFNKGVTSGPATFWHPNGQLESRGEIKDDRPDGKWTYWSLEGKEGTAEWKYGMPIGSSKRIRPDGTPINCKAKGNKKAVVNTCTREDGTRMSTSEWTSEGRKSITCWDTEDKETPCPKDL